MSISTITISSVDYTSYASVAEADAYLAVDPVRATAWAALTTDQKGANLVAATRRIDLLDWSGEKTGGDAQENAWPRTGVSYSSGNDVSTSEVPHEVENAVILLAGTITIDAESANAGTSGSNVKSVGAGSARVTFFRQTTGKALQDETAFGLVRQFLSDNTATSSTGALASGTDAESSFTDIDQWGRNAGYP